MDFLRILKFNPNHDAKGRFTFHDASGWKKVGAQAGSNPGGVFEDEQGTRHYVKFPQQNPKQMHSEKLADSIYSALGIPVKDSQFVQSKGKFGLAGKMLEGSKSMTAAQVNAHKDVKAGRIADAYLANWDVFGMTHDNILSHEGRAYRIDNGASMFHRAQGEAKEFPADRVDELQSMVKPGKKGHAAYGDLSPDEVHEQAARLVKTLGDDKLESMVTDAGFDGEDAKKYLKALKGRRDVIASTFGVKKVDFLNVLKFNPNHGKNGQFASSPAGGPATDLAARERAPLTDDEIISKALPKEDDRAKYRSMVAAAEKHHEGRSSKAENTKADTNRYTPERLKVHRQIISKLLGTPDQYKPKDGSKPNVIFLGGRGGSGKSNFDKERNAAVGVYSSKHYAALNADTVKELLPDYDPQNAAHHHAESVDVLNKAVTVAKKLGKNVTLDVTMRGKVDGWHSTFKKAGYSTEAHFMHAPIDKAAENVVRRAMQPDSFTDITGTKHSSDTGRLVPIHVVRANTHNEQVFDSLRHKVDKWSLVDNADWGFKKVAEGVKKEDSAIDCTEPISFFWVLKNNPYHDEKGKFTTAAHDFIGTHAGGEEFVAAKATAKEHFPGVKIEKEKLEHNPDGSITVSHKHTFYSTAKGQAGHQALMALYPAGIETVYHGNSQVSVKHTLHPKPVETPVVQETPEPQTAETVKAMTKFKALDNGSGYHMEYAGKKVGALLKNQWSYTKWKTLHDPKDDIGSDASMAKHHTMDDGKLALYKKHAAYLNAHPEEIVKPKVKHTAADSAKALGLPPKVLSEAAKAKMAAKNADKLAAATAAYKDMHLPMSLEYKKLKHQGKNSKAQSLMNKMATAENTMMKYGATPEQIGSLKKELDGNVAKHIAEKQKAVVEMYAKAFTMAGTTSPGYGSEAYALKNQANQLIYSEPHLHQKSYEYVRAAQKLNTSKKLDALEKVSEAHKGTDDLHKLEAEKVAKDMGATPNEIEVAKHKAAAPVELPKTKEEALSNVGLTGLAYYKAQAYAKQPTYYNYFIPAGNDSILANAKQAHLDAKHAFIQMGGTHEELASLKPAIKAAGVTAKQVEQEAHGTKKAEHLAALTMHALGVKQQQFEFGDNSVEHVAAKKVLSDAVDDATEFGMQEHEIVGAKSAGQSAFMQKHQEAKKAAENAVNSAISKYHVNDVMKGEDHPDTVAAAAAMQDAVKLHGKYVDAGQVATMGENARKTAVANKESYERLANLGPEIQKRIADYDSRSDDFEYSDNPKPAAESPNSGQWRNVPNPMTQEQANLVEAYTGSAYKNMNKLAGTLSEGVSLAEAKINTNYADGKGKEAVLNQIKTMDAALAGRTVGADMKVRRAFPSVYIAKAMGLDNEALTSMSNADLQSLVGRVYTENAFSSTSMSSSWNSSFTNASNQGRVTMEARLTEDTPGLVYGGGEYEVILPRGATYVIRSIKRNGTTLDVKADYIAHFPKEIA